MGKTVAFIPVRGGSKSIPKKNIRLIAGKPLIWWTVNAACSSASIDEVVVSTDSDEIKEIVASFGFEKVIVAGRSAETATDTASSESALLEFCEGSEAETIVFIQATSPLTSASDLNEALKKYRNGVAESMLSVVRQKRFIWQAIGDQPAQPLNYLFKKRPRRQEFDGFLVENGAFYINSRANILSHQNRLTEPVAVFEMPEETYTELDEPVDWTIIEHLLLQRQRFPAEGAAIKLFLTDVDGVLTDAGMYYSDLGDELKKFNTRDGMGLQMLREAGIKTGIITGEDTRLIERRAKKLQMDFLYKGVKDKSAILDEILKTTGFSPHEVAFIGDDLNDAVIMSRVGLTAAPADAVTDIKKRARYICEKKGGEGCVREFAEWILLSRGQKPVHV